LQFKTKNSTYAEIPQEIIPMITSMIQG